MTFKSLQEVKPLAQIMDLKPDNSLPEKISTSTHNAILQFNFAVCWDYADINDNP